MIDSRSAGARLQRVIPGAKRVVLPESGHAPMLERTVNLLDLLIRTQLVPARAFTQGAAESSTRNDSNGPPPGGAAVPGDREGASEQGATEDAPHKSEKAGNTDQITGEVSCQEKSDRSGGSGHSNGAHEPRPQPGVHRLSFALQHGDRLASLSQGDAYLGLILGPTDWTPAHISARSHACVADTFCLC